MTLIIYHQVFSFEFINYDTDRYIYENNHVKAGLTIDSFFWAITTTDVSNWHPATWLSHMLDVQLFGLDPGWHHLTNVVFHIANTLLLFWIFVRMTGDIWKSGLVAAIFAIHPLHIQSVAWVAERKDVLSTFFGFLAIDSYLRFVRYQRIDRYFLVLVFFILSLMSKPMMVTLPFILLLLDYWPLNRVVLPKTGESNRLKTAVNTNAALVVEKIPLFMMSAASCAVTIYAQHGGGAVGSLVNYPLYLRLANALVSYANYIFKMLWPVKLSIIYPYPGEFSAWQIWSAGLILAAISWLALKNYKLRPWFLVGWLWYLGTLVPVIGLVQAGTQAMADRYTYVPLIGLFVIFAWGLSNPIHIQKKVTKSFAPVLIAVIVLLTLTAISRHQVGYWRNSIALFSRALAVTQDNYVAHNNLGHRLLEVGRIDEAQQHFVESLAINPEFEIAHVNLGLTYSKQGHLDLAIQHYAKALKIRPNYTVAHNNMGNAWYRLRQPQIACGHYLNAIKIDPTYAEAYNNLGAASIRMGDLQKGVFYFRKALSIDPKFASAQSNLSNTLSALAKNRAN